MWPPEDGWGMFHGACVIKMPQKVKVKDSTQDEDGVSVSFVFFNV